MIKLILIKRKEVLENKYYFRTRQSPIEYWEIEKIENQEFYERVIVKGIDNKN